MLIALDVKKLLHRVFFEIPPLSSFMTLESETGPSVFTKPGDDLAPAEGVTSLDDSTQRRLRMDRSWRDTWYFGPPECSIERPA